MADRTLGNVLKSAPPNLHTILDGTLFLQSIMLDDNQGTWLSSNISSVEQVQRTNRAISYGCHNLDHFQDAPTFLILFQCWIDWVVDEADL